MATAKVVKKPATPKPPKFVIKSQTGSSVTLPRAPRMTDFSEMGQVWSESERAGREAVMRRTGKKSKTFSIELQLGVTNPNATVRYQLSSLESLANTTKPVTIVYTNRDSGLFYITDFSYSIDMRRPSDNEPSRATVSMTFRRAVKEQIKVGAIKKPKKPAPKKKKAPPKKKKVRTHKMRKGDTLWDLARKYYGNALKWKKLADANKIKNVRRIPIGKVIKIP